MILNRDQRPLREKIRAMWAQGLDTVAMAKALQIPEATVERELHAVLEIRHSIVNNLGRS